MPNLLKIIADNPALMDALKEVIYKQFTFDNVSNLMTNENIGQVVRSRIDGKILVDNAFKEIAKYKTVAEETIEPMQGR